ncbi:hypothetical protein D6D13_02705 [Aureobasidium pullulans]|uniref:BTB domain-containing protein n=1 Tax=Aureobasidium pullulans TaxID=5580 RepID=A0A4S9D3D6_AURPU|nr:hypothetical protein D6D13_02705 [Aureobasidium pullulans]
MAEPPNQSDDGQSPDDVFNSEEDSEITLVFGKNKVFAHRVILRLWSPFFKRAFKSQFPVATSPTFEFDDQEDCDVVYSMLRHMYNMPYGQHPNNQIRSLQHCIQVFTIADKYDCPLLRETAVTQFTLKSAKLLYTLEATWGTIPNLIVHCIPRLCGPDAPQLADSSLRNRMLEICMARYGRLAQEDVFKKEMQAVRSFDGDAAVKILARVSQRLTASGDTQDFTNLLSAETVEDAVPIASNGASACSLFERRVLARMRGGGRGRGRGS